MLNQYLDGINVRAGHNAVATVRLKPAALRSRVKHSTNEPLPSQKYIEHIKNTKTQNVSNRENILELGNRGFYMSDHVLLNLLSELGKRDNCEACRAFYLFFATSLINSIIQKHESKILFIT